MEEPVDEWKITGRWRITVSCFRVCDNEGNVGIARLTGSIVGSKFQKEKQRM